MNDPSTGYKKVTPGDPPVVSTPRHRRPAATAVALRSAGTWTAALGLGALSAAGVTTLGAPAASSSAPESSPGASAGSSVTAGVAPVVLADAAPLLGPVRVSCEPGATARFDDPSHPDRITNKACGYRDGSGRARSADPWISEQLAAAQ